MSEKPVATSETHEWCGEKCGIWTRYEYCDVDEGPSYLEGDRVECMQCDIEGCLALCVPVSVPDVALPMQPLVLTDTGSVRFRANAIVHYLWKSGHVDMNALALLGFPREDRAQFAQLLGYSVDGASMLSYFSHKTITHAETLAKELECAHKHRLATRKGSLK